MSDHVIQVEHLCKSFGDVKAVKDLSFDVEARKCYAFLGPNGAGTTTAMKVLYGKAIPDRNAATRVRIFGFDPQHDNLDVELNVYQNLRIFSRFYRMSRVEAERRIDYLLDFMELREKRKSRVRELSGGMFAALGLLVTSFVDTINHFNFFFSGVFFPIDNLPAIVRPISEALPLTHAVRLARALALQTPNPLWWFDILYVAVFIGVVGWIAILRIEKRLID